MQKSIEEQNKEEMVVFLPKFGVEEKQYEPFLTIMQHVNLCCYILQSNRYNDAQSNKERLPYDKTLIYRIIPSTSEKGCLVILVVSGYFERESGKPLLHRYRCRMQFDEENKPYLEEGDSDDYKEKRYYTLKDFLKYIPYYIVLGDYTKLTIVEYNKHINKKQ